MKKQNIALSFILLFFLPVFLCSGQNREKLNELISKLQKTTVDSVKFGLYNALAIEYRKTNFDTSKIIAVLGYETAVKMKSPFAIAVSLNTLGSTYLNNDNEKALHYYEQSLAKYRELKDSEGESLCLSNMGGVYTYMGDYNKAIQYTIQALKIKEKRGNKEDMASSYNNLLALSAYIGNYRDGIRYGLKALQLRKESHDENGVAASYGNIGSCYYN